MHCMATIPEMKTKVQYSNTCRFHSVGSWSGELERLPPSLTHCKCVYVCVHVCACLHAHALCVWVHVCVRVHVCVYFCLYSTCMHNCTKASHSSF